jgi:membrane protease subunit HflC
MKAKWPVVAVIALVVLVLMLYLFSYSVRVDQVAAHYRFGKVKHIIKPPFGAVGALVEEAGEEVETRGVPVKRRAGWFFKLPIVDKVRRFDQRIRHVDGPLAQLQLPDENQVIPRVYATWRITDPVAFEETLMGEEEKGAQTVKESIGGRTPEVIGRYNLDDLVNTEPQELKFDKIEQEIFEAVKASIESSEKAYGIKVCSLGITWIALPEDATRAVFGRMEQERRTEAEKLTKEGERIKRTTVAAAKEQRAKVLADAEARARSIRAEGEAEAAEHYEVFALDQELAIFLRRLEAIRQIAENAADRDQPITFVLSTKTEPFGTLEADPLERAAPGEDEAEFIVPEPVEEEGSEVGSAASVAAGGAE